MHFERALYLHAEGAFEQSPDTMTLKRDTLTRALAQRTRSDEQRAQRRSFIMNGPQGPDAGKLARTYSAEADTRGGGGRRASMPHAAGEMLRRGMGIGGGDRSTVGDRSSVRRSTSGDNVAHVRGGHDEHRYACQKSRGRKLRSLAVLLKEVSFCRTHIPQQRNREFARELGKRALQRSKRDPLTHAHLIRGGPQRELSRQQQQPPHMKRSSSDPSVVRPDEVREGRNSVRGNI